MSGASAFFGKLPAHGDFVRRGDSALVALLEAWLDAEVSRHFAATGAVPAPPPRGLAIVGAGGAVIASRDAVGRAFPIVAVVAWRGDDAVAATLAAARDDGSHADTLLARLLDAPLASEAVDPDASDAGDWPDAAALDRLRALLADAGL